MIHLLIIDDDKELLSVMARSFKRREEKWVVKTSHSAEEALKILEKFDFDAILCDLQMPGIHGDELLKTVAKKSPSSLRLLHSGAVNAARIVAAMGCAHRLFEKPCSIVEVCQVIKRGYAVKLLIDSKPLLNAIAQAEKIPAIPETFFALRQLLAEGDFYLPRLVRRIERDPSVTTALLKAANTAFFSTGVSVQNIEQALFRLGIRTVSSILLYSELFSALPTRLVAKLGLDSRMSRALEVGALAKSYAADCNEAEAVQDQAFLAGLLSDIGSLLLAQIAPAKLEEIIEEEQITGGREIQFERDLLGASTEELGAYFLTLWGLPIEIVEAVAFFGEPDRSQEHARSPLSYVAAANLVLRGEDELAGELFKYFEKLGLEQHLCKWWEDELVKK